MLRNICLIFLKNALIITNKLDKTNEYKQTSLNRNVTNQIHGGLDMREYIEERTVELAQYIVENKATVRAAAKKFGISKSTVHKDVTERLKGINLSLAQEVKMILEENKAERHIRGGEATKEKYKHIEEK